MDVRRVVTGHDADGKAVFVSDGPVAPVTTALLAGQRVPPAVGRRRGAALPRRRVAPAAPTYFPPVGGFRFGHFTLPPDGGARSCPPTSTSPPPSPRWRRSSPGMTGHMEPDDAGHAHHRHRRLRGRPVRARSPSSSTTAPRSRSAPATPSCRTAPATAGATPATCPWCIAVFLVGAHHDRVTRHLRDSGRAVRRGRHPPGPPRRRAPRVQQVPRRVLARASTPSTSSRGSSTRRWPRAAGSASPCPRPTAAAGSASPRRRSCSRRSPRPARR